MTVVVQWVRTTWTKRSRGEPGASRRNAVPVGFRLPDDEAPFVHGVVMREQDDFKVWEGTRSGLPDEVTPTRGREQLESGVEVTPVGGLIQVQLTATPYGLPPRPNRARAVRLAPDEWVRWQINYRYPSHWGEDWVYRLDTLNLFHGSPPLDAFLGEPTYEVKELASLF
ncbi:hypothetical protein ACFTSF_37655 [Kribbella sp. NPDC056951]|uniref:Uncharacterized protein n=1 Tax=Kribbella yunnanensis TaxID=190194 RepID=A0ABN2IME8_9ACTN